jgi:hypothetical protein
MWRTILCSLALTTAVYAQADKDAKKEEEKQKEEAAKAKIADYNKDFKAAKSDADRQVAIQKLGELQHPKILAVYKPLLVHRVRMIAEAAATQVATYKKDAGAADALIAAAGAWRDKDMIIILLRHAGDVGFRPSFAKLVPFIKNKSNEIAKEAIDALGKLKSGQSIDPLLNLARELDAIRDDAGQVGAPPIPLPGGGPAVPGGGNQAQEEERQRKQLLGPIHSALGMITGQAYRTVPEWNKWWGKNKSSFKEPAE